MTRPGKGKGWLRRELSLICGLFDGFLLGLLDRVWEGRKVSSSPVCPGVDVTAPLGGGEGLLLITSAWSWGALAARKSSPHTGGWWGCGCRAPQRSELTDPQSHACPPATAGPSFGDSCPLRHAQVVGSVGPGLILGSLSQWKGPSTWPGVGAGAAWFRPPGLALP